MALQRFALADTAVRSVEPEADHFRMVGLVVPWHVEFERMGQAFTFTPDSLTLPDDLSTVKLLLEHDPERPIGYAVDAVSTDNGLVVAFDLPTAVPRSADAMTEYQARLRDGFSVGVEPSEDTLQVMMSAMLEGPSPDALPFAGTLREVSQVAIPQFNNARASAMERKATRPLVTLGSDRKPKMQTDTVPALPSVASAVETFRVMEAPEFAELAGRVAALESGSRPGSHPLARFASLADAIRAGLTEGRVNFVLADNIANGTLNAGVVPPAWLSSVAGIVARRRVVVEAFGGPGQLPADGFTTNWPYYDGDLSTLVGIQTAQKTDITSASVDIKNGQAPVVTYAGGADNALQLIERSSPPFLEVWGRIMAAAYAVVTDADFTARVAAAGTGTSVIDWATATADTVRAWLFDASAKVDDATGAPAEFALVAADVFAKLGGMAGLHNPTYGTNNAVGTASASTLQINVNGLPVLKARGLAAGATIVSNREAARFMEDGPSFIDALNVAKLGRDSAIYGYGAAHIYVPAGIVESVPLAARTGNGGNGGKFDAGEVRKGRD